MRSQVRQLDLSLSLPPSLRSESWAIARELRDGLITDVVEAVEAKLHAQFGSDAIIEIPELRVEWDGHQEVLTDYDGARQIVEAIADEFVAKADPRAVDSPTDPTAGAVRVFRSLAHRSAVRIATESEVQSRRASIDRAAEIEAEWRAVSEQGKECVLECVEYLAEYADAESVVDALSDGILVRVLGIAPVAHWPQAFQARIQRRSAIVASGVAGTGDEDGVSEAAVDEARVPANGKPTDGPVFRVDSERSMGDSAQSRAPTGYDRVDRAPDASRGKGGVVTSEPAVQPLSPERRSTSSADQRIEVPAGTGDSVDHPRDVRYSSAEATPAPAFAGVARSAMTRYVGLVYVVNLLRRIELPEILWCCAIDERSFLFDVLASIAGEDWSSDPVLYALTGVSPDHSNYENSLVPEWVFDEVSKKTDRNLDAYLSRTGLDNAWLSEPLPLAAIEDGFWQALVKRVSSRLRRALLIAIGADGSTDLAAFIELNGVVEQADSDIVIRTPIESVNVDVRKATLDADPGYLEWHKTTVRLVFDCGSDGRWP